MFMRGRVASRPRGWRGEGHPARAVSHRICGRTSLPIPTTLLDTHCRTESYLSYCKHSSTVLLTRHTKRIVCTPPGRARKNLSSSSRSGEATRDLSGISHAQLRVTRPRSFERGFFVVVLRCHPERAERGGISLPAYRRARVFPCWHASHGFVPSGSRASHDS